jgi:Uma2 family endonuclease
VPSSRPKRQDHRRRAIPLSRRNRRVSPGFPTATVADDPVVVFEVLSEGSIETDLIDRNREYRATSSIRRYVVLQQTHMAAIVFVRRADGWLLEIVSGDDARLDLPEIGIAVPLHEVYANAGLSEVPQEAPTM